MVAVAGTPRYQIMAQRESTDKVREVVEEVFSPETTVKDGVVGSSIGRVHVKLRALYALRMELDRDIQALKRTADILEDGCP
jgi:hypothetical protein